MANSQKTANVQPAKKKKKSVKKKGRKARFTTFVFLFIIILLIRDFCRNQHQMTCTERIILFDLFGIVNSLIRVFPCLFEFFVRLLVFFNVSNFYP